MGRLWEGGCLSGGDLVWQLGSEWSLLDSAYDKVLDPRWGLAGLCGGILYLKWHVLLVLSGIPDGGMNPGIKDKKKKMLRRGCIWHPEQRVYLASE